VSRVPSREESGVLQTFTSHDFRATVGAFATGVTVVTTRGEDHAYGMTANAFSSVSLDPPLILVCVISGSEGADHISRNGVFAVNILSAEQEPLSRYFASRDRPKGRDAFGEVSHRIGASGSPILSAAAAALDCRLHSAYEAGDHDIFIGEVLELELLEGHHPLVFHGGKYGLLEQPPTAG
jgi:flavin reductase (DIM6/NTAB) family NADH-FMN oxidoreductase RutF